MPPFQLVPAVEGDINRSHQGRQGACHTQRQGRPFSREAGSGSNPRPAAGSPGHTEVAFSPCGSSVAIPPPRPIERSSAGRASKVISEVPAGSARLLEEEAAVGVVEARLAGGTPPVIPRAPQASP